MKAEATFLFKWLFAKTIKYDLWTSNGNTTNESLHRWIPVTVIKLYAYLLDIVAADG